MTDLQELMNGTFTAIILAKRIGDEAEILFSCRSSELTRFVSCGALQGALSSRSDVLGLCGVRTDLVVNPDKGRRGACFDARPNCCSLEQRHDPVELLGGF
jgi:hypothetical protein